MPHDKIEFLSPSGAIKPTGPWSLGVRAGDFVFVAGMRGIDPATNTLVDGDEARARQAFLNMKTIVESAGVLNASAVRANIDRPPASSDGFIGFAPSAVAFFSGPGGLKRVTGFEPTIISLGS